MTDSRLNARYRNRPKPLTPSESFDWPKAMRLFRKMLAEVYGDEGQVA